MNEAMSERADLIFTGVPEGLDALVLARLVEEAAEGERAGIVLRDIENGARKGDVACGACGESSPSNFDLCWNCGGGLEGAG